MKSYKPLESKTQKLQIEKIIQDCRKIANDYIKNWQVIDSKWETVAGCAYLRLSTDQQVAVEKGSLEQQIYIAINEAENRSNADKLNYRITHFFIEPGLTGRNDDRPEFLAMRTSIKRQEYKFVIFKEIARIARDATIWKDFFKLCIQSECEVFIRGLPINPNDPTSLLQLDILAAFAEYESNQISKRTRESNFSAMVTSGKFNSTHQVLGLDQLIVNSEPKVGFYVANASELEAVEWIMRTFLKYGSQQKTIEECEKRGIKNKNGKVFKKNSLTTLLTNKKYIGKWVVNSENKEKPQQKLLPYDKYKEIDLPHGCVIDIDLWNSVQATLSQIAGKNTKNTRLTRIYSLSGVLQFTDGSPFHGRSAYSSKGVRNNYYYNKNIKHPFHAEDLEAEAKKVAVAIIRENDQVQDAVKRRCKDIKSLTDLIQGQAEKLTQEIAALEKDKLTLDKRLDFLLAGGSNEDAKLFKDNYKNKMVEINEQLRQKKESLGLMTTKGKDLKDDTFDWKSVKSRATEILDLIQEHDPVALKRAYSQLFEAIVVGDLDNTGKRPLQFILKENDEGPKIKKPGVNQAEHSCVTIKMAQTREPISLTRASSNITLIAPLWSTSLHRSEPFLRQKYVKEGLSIHQIADKYGSSRQTISQALRRYGIEQTPRLNLGQIGYGQKLKKGRLVANTKEMAVIQKVTNMRASGNSYWAIADWLNAEGYKTKNRVQGWSAVTVYKIVNRAERSSLRDGQASI